MQRPQLDELPQNIKTVVLLTGMVTFVWIWYFMELMFISLRPCKDTLGCWNSEFALLQTEAVSSAVALAWFAGARLLLFLVPAVAAYASRASGRGRCHFFMSSVALRDGPRYILMGMAGWLFLKMLWSDTETLGAPHHQLFKSAQVQAVAAFMTYAFVTFALSALCFMLGARHNDFLDGHDARFLAGHGKCAPPGTVDKLTTQRYDPAVFGDEDGKAYPAECAICLCSYDTNDEIKVTPCGHAFHKDCISHWLTTAYTCALCRGDLVELVTSTPTGGLDVADVV
jgi:hypothetical protein